MRRALHLAAAALAALFLLPLAAMVSTSLKGGEEVRASELLSPPKRPSAAAWRKAWSGACIGVSCEGLRGYFFNSLRVVVPAVILSTMAGAVNGYVLSFWRFPRSELVFGLLTFGCFIPFQVVILPMARLLGFLRLSGGVSGLVLVHCVYGLAFTTLFFRNFYAAVPRELVKAAMLDGAGFAAVFLRIIWPLSPPIVLVTAVWQFTNIWNDFLFGAVFSAGGAQPVTVALNNLVNASTGVKEYNVDMAGALIAGLPTLAVYAASGRFFVRGLTAGAVKG